MATRPPALRSSRASRVAGRRWGTSSSSGRRAASGWATRWPGSSSAVTPGVGRSGSRPRTKARQSSGGASPWTPSATAGARSLGRFRGSRTSRTTTSSCSTSEAAGGRERPGRCYPLFTTFHLLGEMGAGAPICFERDEKRDGDGHVRQGARADGGDHAGRRVDAARGRSARGRAALPGAVLRLRRPPGRRRLRALRACHAPAGRLPGTLDDRCLVTRARAAGAPARALPPGDRRHRKAEDGRREAPSRNARRGRRPRRDRLGPRHCTPDSGRRDRPGQPDRRGRCGMSQEIIEGIRTIEKEKGIETGTLVAALEDALLAAYKKTPGAARHATVELDDEGEFRVFALDIPGDLEARLLDEARERAIDELERIEEETGEKQHTLIVDDELDLDWEQVPDDLVDKSDATPDDFGRIAAMTAKQVIQQRIREAERAMMYEEYVDRQGEVVTGIVQQAGDRNNVLVDLGKVEALLPRSEQVDGERYEQGSRIKAVIIEVRSGTKGPQVILSRRAPQLIEALFELEVPEIADGLVEIRGVAREPGYRSKIAVESHVQGVDPVGACVGPRGSRVRMVVSELRGEKIDIIPWNTEPARFVAKALSPARVREVYIDDESRDATVVVPDDQLALAIGKEGLNARLAARLTGWKVDIKSDSEFAQAEADAAFAGEDDGDGDFSGRCAALLSNGKRCPNAALPGSKYCGVPAHQAIASDPTAGASVAVAAAVADDVALAEEAVAEVEEALAAGELTVEEADAAEGAVEDTAEVAIAVDVEAAGVAPAEETSDGA